MSVSHTPLRIFGPWWELRCSLVPLVPACPELMLEVCVIVIFDLLIVQQWVAIGDLHSQAAVGLGCSGAD